MLLTLLKLSEYLSRQQTVARHRASPAAVTERFSKLCNTENKIVVNELNNNNNNIHSLYIYLYNVYLFSFLIYIYILYGFREIETKNVQFIRVGICKRIGTIIMEAGTARWTYTYNKLSGNTTLTHIIRNEYIILWKHEM